MAVGRILRFDEVRGYGFIAAPDGGEDVFVHANDFGEQRHLVHPGMRVEYEAAEGDRGMKVDSVRILDAPATVAGAVRSSAVRAEVTSADDDDDVDVLTRREFVTEITEVLIQHVPSLTGAQIGQIRQRLVEHARSHGWVDL